MIIVAGNWIPILEEMLDHFRRCQEGQSGDYSKMKINVRPISTPLKVLTIFFLMPNTFFQICQSKSIEINIPDLSSNRGAIELKPTSGIFIDKTDLSDACRFTDQPREMVRRLMLHIIKEENLIKMTPLGNSNRTGIPEKHRKAVFCK